jgi:hydrogenase maturation protein HypF
MVCDRHPDYASSLFAEEQGLPVRRVQHHLAHALSAMVEHGLEGPLLAVTWDGTGLGSDGRIWGGEFLRVERRAGGVRWQRVAHLREFGLPGGDAAVRDPQRALAGLLWEMPRHRERVPADLSALLARGLNAPRCSSMGRLFDGVAAALGHGASQSFEGMAASLVERDAWTGDGDAPLDGLAPVAGRPMVLDWAPLMTSLLAAVDAGAARESLCRTFHARLAQAVVDVARVQGLPRVLLTGGCFQNRLLSRLCMAALREAGFEAVIPRRLPPNDGGIALGQLAAMAGAHEHVPGDTRSH